jgi:hypothetical protein
LIIQQNNQKVFTSKSRIPNGYIDLNSHRREAFGIISALSHLVQIQLFNEVKHLLSPITSTIVRGNQAGVNTINRLRHGKLSLKNIANRMQTAYLHLKINKTFNST